MRHGQEERIPCASGKYGHRVVEIGDCGPLVTGPILQRPYEPRVAWLPSDGGLSHVQQGLCFLSGCWKRGARIAHMTDYDWIGIFPKGVDDPPPGLAVALKIARSKPGGSLSVPGMKVLRPEFGHPCGVGCGLIP